LGVGGDRVPEGENAGNAFVYLSLARDRPNAE